MKKLLLCILLVSCQQKQPVGEEMSGKKVNIEFPAYSEMCKREPSSVLCKEN